MRGFVERCFVGSGGGQKGGRGRERGVERRAMGSLLGDWPSYDPHNFSQFRPADPSAQSSKVTPVTYQPTHSRTLPPPDQVITTEARNILLRHFYKKSEEKLRLKRAASDHLTPEHSCKQPRGSYADEDH